MKRNDALWLVGLLLLAKCASDNPGHVAFLATYMAIWVVGESVAMVWKVSRGRAVPFLADVARRVGYILLFMAFLLLLSG